MILVTEYIHGSDLATALRTDRGSPRKLGWYRNGATIALGIARGLAYLHNAVVWLAATPRNVMLDQTGSSAKITGFETKALAGSSSDLWQVIFTTCLQNL